MSSSPSPSTSPSAGEGVSGFSPPLQIVRVCLDQTSLPLICEVTAHGSKAHRRVWVRIAMSGCPRRSGWELSFDVKFPIAGELFETSVLCDWSE